MRSRSGGSCHFSPFQAFVITKQTARSISATSYQRLGVFPRLSDFNDILQLDFTDLSSGEFQLSATTNRLSFLQLLDLCVASRNKFGLVRCLILSFPLTFSPFRFFVVRLALIFQAAKTLTYWGAGDTSLFVGCVIETGGGLLLEGNVCVVLYERVSENCEARKKRKFYIRPFPFSWPYVACCGKLVHLKYEKGRSIVHDTSSFKLSLLLQDGQSSCFLQLTLSGFSFRLLPLSVSEAGTSFG